MFIMAIAGGFAYNYDNYVSRVMTNTGTFGQVIKDTIRTFKQDSRLIKPKKFGFDAKHLEEKELVELKNGRASATVDTKVQEDVKKCYI